MLNLGGGSENVQFGNVGFDSVITRVLTHVLMFCVQIMGSTGGGGGGGGAGSTNSASSCTCFR